MAQLVLNWHDDAFVLRQRMNCLGYSPNEHSSHKAPHALPEYGYLRWCRLFLALIVIFGTLQLAPCDDNQRHLCDYDVSHVTHSFGALSGLLAGCLFLKVRHFKKCIRYFRNTLLGIYGFIVSAVIIKFLLEEFDDDKEHLSWNEYETMCQNQCYGQRMNCNANVTICNSFC